MDWLTEGSLAINRYLEAGATYGQAVALESEMEDGRALEKQAAVLRLMNGSPNPATGKQHSASSAEAVVESDPQYTAYRTTQRAATVAKNTAFTQVTAARLQAELAIAALHASAPVPA